MPTLRIGLDHYSIADNTEESFAIYGEPCVLLDAESGDILFAHLDIPDEDGSVRAAPGCDIAIYRLTAPSSDQLEDTVVEDVGPDGFDFEREEDYESPFAEYGEEGEEEGEEEEGEGEEEEEEEAVTAGADGEPV